MQEHAPTLATVLADLDDAAMAVRMCRPDNAAMHARAKLTNARALLRDLAATCQPATPAPDQTPEQPR